MAPKITIHPLTHEGRTKAARTQFRRLVLRGCTHPLCESWPENQAQLPLWRASACCVDDCSRSFLGNTHAHGSTDRGKGPCCLPAVCSGPGVLVPLSPRQPFRAYQPFRVYRASALRRMADCLEIDDDGVAGALPLSQQSPWPPPASAPFGPCAPYHQSMAPPMAPLPPSNIPGPAGLVDSIVEKRDGFGGNGSAMPMVCSQPLTKAGRNPSFIRSEAYLEVESWLGEDIPGRQSLYDLRLHASCGAVDPSTGHRPGKPPAAPVRSSVLLVSIVSLEEEVSGSEDVVATLADDSGEIGATLHAGLLSEHPGCVAVGSAWALKRVGVLTLAPHSHHLIVHPNNALHATPPPQGEGGSEHASARSASDEAGEPAGDINKTGTLAITAAPSRRCPQSEGEMGAACARALDTDAHEPPPPVAAKPAVATVGLFHSVRVGHTEGDERFAEVGRQAALEEEAERQNPRQVMGSQSSMGTPSQPHVPIRPLPGSSRLGPHQPQPQPTTVECAVPVMPQGLPPLLATAYPTLTSGTAVQQPASFPLQPCAPASASANAGGIRAHAAYLPPPPPVLSQQGGQQRTSGSKRAFDGLRHGHQENVVRASHPPLAMSASSPNPPQREPLQPSEPQPLQPSQQSLPAGSHAYTIGSVDDLEFDD